MYICMYVYGYFICTIHILIYICIVIYIYIYIHMSKDVHINMYIFVHVGSSRQTVQSRNQWCLKNSYTCNVSEMTTDLACSIRQTLHVLSQIPLKMLQPPNPPNPETQISRCKFKWARGSEAHRAEAAARHQGRSQRMREKFRGLSNYRYRENYRYPEIGDR